MLSVARLEQRADRRAAGEAELCWLQDGRGRWSRVTRLAERVVFSRNRSHAIVFVRVQLEVVSGRLSTMVDRLAWSWRVVRNAGRAFA
jgi:hypothetical protein